MDTARVRHLLRWINRLLTSMLALVAALLLYARFVEPRWLAVRTIRLSAGAPACRIVHISDIHYKGERRFLARVVQRINALRPDAVCFTGDLVEDNAYVAEALAVLKTIHAPVYGVPGNHDYWSHVSFSDMATALEATTGAWLVDATRSTPDGRMLMVGLVRSCRALPSTFAWRATRTAGRSGSRWSGRCWRSCCRATSAGMSAACTARRRVRSTSVPGSGTSTSPCASAAGRKLR